MLTYLLHLLAAFVIALPSLWLQCVLRVKVAKSGTKSFWLQCLIALVWIGCFFFPSVLLIIRSDLKLEEQAWSGFHRFLLTSFGTLGMAVAGFVIFRRYFDRNGKPRERFAATPPKCDSQ